MRQEVVSTNQLIGLSFHLAACPQVAPVTLVGELKRELIDRGDPSFVFNDPDELIAALQTARKMSEISADVQAQPAPRARSKSATRRKVHASYAVIPTIDEEGEAKQIQVTKPSVRKPRLGRRGSFESKGIKSKRNSTLSGNEQNNESVRLVEYFIVVSSKPSTKRPSEIEDEDPLDPDVDDLDPRTEMRFDSRSAHLPGVEGRVDHVHLSSIRFLSSSSTSSTCSSDDFDSSVRSSDKDIVMPTNTNFSGVSESRRMTDGNLLTDCVLEPVITARYPAEDRPTHQLNPKLPQFCHPEGSEFIYPTTVYKMPRIHHFVLTDSNAGKLYGTCLTVYEEFDTGATDDSEDAGKKKTTYYTPRVLCLLSADRKSVV